MTRAHQRNAAAATPAEPARFSVFIAHASADADAAERLRNALRAHGESDSSQATGDLEGAQRRTRDARLIEACTAFVFLISPESIESAACLAQLDQAGQLRRPIVPVLVRELPREQIPPSLAARHWVALGDSDDFDAGVAKLIETLRTDLAWRDDYTRLTAA